MGLTGDFAAIHAFIGELGNVKKAARTIAKAAGPKIEAIISAEFSAGTDPYGNAWEPRKDGEIAFSGSDADGRVKMSIVDDQTLRTTLDYPMHFHQDGTKSMGRKSQRKISKALRDAGVSRKSIKDELAFQRKNGIQRLPARPIIPTDEDGIPDPWKDAILEAAVSAMSKIGATPKGGG